MILIFNNGYPDYIGYRQAFVGHGTGPASYDATAGDPVTLQNPRRFIDILFIGQSLSGTYTVIAKPTAIGERQVWSAFWYTTSGMTPVAGATPLNGETVVMGGFCGQY